MGPGEEMEGTRLPQTLPMNQALDSVILKLVSLLLFLHQDLYLYSYRSHFVIGMLSNFLSKRSLMNDFPLLDSGFLPCMRYREKLECQGASV